MMSIPEQIPQTESVKKKGTVSEHPDPHIQQGTRNVGTKTREGNQNPRNSEAIEGDEDPREA